MTLCRTVRADYRDGKFRLWFTLPTATDKGSSEMVSSRSGRVNRRNAAIAATAVITAPLASVPGAMVFFV
jgi:hypothetical protein